MSAKSTVFCSWRRLHFKKDICASSAYTQSLSDGWTADPGIRGARGLPVPPAAGRSVCLLHTWVRLARPAAPVTFPPPQPNARVQPAPHTSRVLTRQPGVRLRLPLAHVYTRSLCVRVHAHAPLPLPTPLQGGSSPRKLSFWKGRALLSG